ncbi:MAG TPA: permease [Candidatus Limnocylindrales bacterium]|nr:permease [Candidatus Limnocylindrales bacterium]
MAGTVWILIILAAALFFFALSRKDDSHKKGIKSGASLFYSYLPLLTMAFLAAGLLQVVIPASLIEYWLGAGAGWRGILIGSATGMLVAAGPYISLPIFASIMQSGAGVGTTVALLTSWCVMSFSKLPFETALLGPRFTLARISLVILIPVIAGFLAQLLFSGSP